MVQRKKTHATECYSDLPDLTEQQMRFVEGILAGKTASDAYRAAYDCSKSKSNTVWVNASRLRNDANVSLWIAEATKAGLAHAGRSLEQHIRKLDRLQELCIREGNLGAAVQAEQLVGKASGHYVDQYRDMTRDPTDLLREIASISPALAQQLAQENGIEWQNET